ncbi:MAG: lipoate--protein ligase [Bacteroidales bacterium]
MLYYIDKNTNPYFNLAAEEYLFRQKEEPIFRLWRNEPAVIIGQYQNAFAEIHKDFIEENHIPVVRRLSGGGAVFHDTGNINFTFIDQKKKGEDTAMMFKRFTRPIIEALKKLDVNAYLEGRNDLLIDNKKFSGNAIAVYKNRVLQHGTLLFSSSITNLNKALNTRPEKFVGKAVKSNISRVTNISEHLSGTHVNMTPEEFMQFLYKFIANTSKLVDYTEEDLIKINKLRKNKYETYEWIWGKSPKYQYSNSIKLPCGFIETYLNIEKGQIKTCRIMGDYFFLKPTEDISKALIECPIKSSEIKNRLSKFNLKDYFGQDILKELTKLLSVA